MFENVIFSNDNVKLYLEDDEVWMSVLTKNYSLQALTDIIKDYPRVSLLHFVAVKTALSNGISSPVKVGVFKPKIELTISLDKLTAYAMIYMTEKEFEDSDKKLLIGEIIDLAVAQSISYGVDIKGILQAMKPNERFEVARGTAPIPGNNAIVKMYETKRVEPLLFDDGKVNHYEMNLINKVENGEWLGERIEPTEGTPGKNILGEEIPAQNGQQEKLLYDTNSVIAYYDSQKNTTFLYASRNGAVVYDRETIGVCNYIELSGDVCLQTGNIDFDGFVDIKRSVDDNFSVRAMYDIQVLGDIGIGGVDTIQSKEGSIYIRGGIAGKNKAKIICQGDFYTKFASDCTIECEGTVNIGYYAMNCTITAKEVVLSSSTSKIIGGVTKATIRVEAGELGSKGGIQTKIHVTGFDRKQLKQEYDAMGNSIEKYKEKVDILKRNLSKYTGDAVKTEDREKYEGLVQELQESKKNLDLLVKQRKKYQSYLLTKGEGEIKARSSIYQNVILKIGEEMLVNRDYYGLPRSYYLEENEIKSE